MDETVAKRYASIGIAVTRRADDFHACVVSSPALWDVGNTPQEAVGNLLLTHPEQFQTRASN